MRTAERQGPDEQRPTQGWWWQLRQGRQLRPKAGAATSSDSNRRCSGASGGGRSKAHTRRRRPSRSRACTASSGRQEGSRAMAGGASVAAEAEHARRGDVHLEAEDARRAPGVEKPSAGARAWSSELGGRRSRLGRRRSGSRDGRRSRLGRRRSGSRGGGWIEGAIWASPAAQETTRRAEEDSRQRGLRASGRNGAGQGRRKPWALDLESPESTGRRSGAGGARSGVEELGSGGGAALGRSGTRTEEAQESRGGLEAQAAVLRRRPEDGGDGE